MTYAPSTPDGSSLPIALNDDGAAGDSTAADGTYSGLFVTPSVGGLYRASFTASVSPPDGAAITRQREMFFAVGASSDLAIAPASVTWNPGVPVVGSTTELRAVVRNTGYSPADSVDVFFLDTETGGVLASARVSVPVGDSVSISTQWTPTAIGEHHVRAQVALLGALEINLQNKQEDVVVPVTAAGPVSVPGNTDILPRRFEFAPPRPNPSRGQVTFDFAVPRSALVLLEVYDILGRRVKTVENGVLAPGRYTRAWTGLTTAGSMAKSGVYFVRFSGPGVDLRRKTVLIR